MSGAGEVLVAFHLRDCTSFEFQIACDFKKCIGIHMAAKY